MTTVRAFLSSLKFSKGKRAILSLKPFWLRLETFSGSTDKLETVPFFGDDPVAHPIFIEKSRKHMEKIKKLWGVEFFFTVPTLLTFQFFSEDYFCAFLSFRLVRNPSEIAEERFQTSWNDD